MQTAAESAQELMSLIGKASLIKNYLSTVVLKVILNQWPILLTIYTRNLRV